MPAVKHDCWHFSKMNQGIFSCRTPLERGCRFVPHGLSNAIMWLERRIARFVENFYYFPPPYEQDVALSLTVCRESLCVWRGRMQGLWKTFAHFPSRIFLMFIDSCRVASYQIFRKEFPVGDVRQHLACWVNCAEHPIRGRNSGCADH